MSELVFNPLWGHADSSATITCVREAEEVEVQLETPECRGGELVRGSVTIHALPSRAVGRTELSVMWLTRGEGESDAHVVFHALLSPGPKRNLDGIHRHQFEAPLPLMPRSYKGEVLEIVWLVRIRIVTPENSRDVVHDHEILVR